MATSYDTVGNEIHRNGELVAKVIDGELVMEEGKEKYLTPCSKMVKKILAKLEDESSEPAPFLPPFPGSVCQTVNRRDESKGYPAGQILRPGRHRATTVRRGA